MLRAADADFACGYVCAPTPLHIWAVRRYIYQKAYVECFCSTEKVEALEAAVTENPSLTYMAVNSAGDFRSNQPSAGAERLCSAGCSALLS